MQDKTSFKLSLAKWKAQKGKILFLPIFVWRTSFAIGFINIRRRERERENGKWITKSYNRNNENHFAMNSWTHTYTHTYSTQIGAALFFQFLSLLRFYVSIWNWKIFKRIEFYRHLSAFKCLPKLNILKLTKWIK